MPKQKSERRRRGRVPVCLAVKVRLEGEEIAVASRDLTSKAWPARHTRFCAKTPAVG